MNTATLPTPSVVIRQAENGYVATVLLTDAAGRTMRYGEPVIESRNYDDKERALRLARAAILRRVDDLLARIASEQLATAAPLVSTTAL